MFYFWFFFNLVRSLLKVSMKIHLLLPYVFVLLVLSSSVARGDSEVKPAYFFSGILDLTNAFSEDGLPKVNQFRRGDSLFDNMRLTLFGDVVFSRRLALFNQIIVDPTSRASLSSYYRPYVRFTAFETGAGELHLEAGKLPTVFGAYSPQAYSNRNPLVSMPLMYHYFTSLRGNQLPADNADLIRHRGEGPSTEFTGYGGGGANARFNGLPLIYDTCWDSGVQVVGAVWRFEVLAAVTQGTLSDPRSGGGDNNEGKQTALHVDFVPTTGLVVGASFAGGPYLDASVGDTLLAQNAGVEDFHQKAFGFNLEYGIQRLFVSGEVIFNKWETPNIVDAQGNLKDLETVSWYAGLKYMLRPGFYIAGRYDHIFFGKIDDGAGSRVPWDEPVQRWEVGLGYSFRDGVIGKIVRQDVRREHLDPANPSSHDFFWATQLELSY